MNQLGFDDIWREIKRRLPDLPEPLGRFIAEQLEFEPHHTYELLDALIQALDGNSSPDRVSIGLELRSLRLKYVPS